LTTIFGCAVLEELIKKEIQWCKKNLGTSNENKEYERGFVDGLKQSLKLMDLFIQF
jgi:hypothetical protein